MSVVGAAGAAMVPPQVFVSKTVLVRHVATPGATEVVVTCESAHNGIKRSDAARGAWGEKFLVEHGYAVVGLMPRAEAHWYRREDVWNLVDSAWLREILSRYRLVHSYGSSMGAYAACAFAEALGAHNVVAMSPVLTLAPDLVPWEVRFRHAAAFDWTGPYRDGVAGLSREMKVYFLYGEKTFDARHVKRAVERLGPAARRIAIPGVRHDVAEQLARRGVLKQVALGCLRGEPTAHIVRLIGNACANASRGVSDRARSEP